jgi:RimJ/RimL family protein N-acetyltransferase
MSWLEPVTLENEHARLEPLSHKHHDELCEAASDGELWNLWYTSIPSPSEMTAEIDRRLDLQTKGTMLPLTVLQVSTGRAVGMTTYMDVDQANRRVEIGSTWYARSAQRSSLNTACKLLLLQHAFETLNCIAVEFRTHFFNHQSGAQLNAWVRNSMESCATIALERMASCATHVFTAFCRRSGRQSKLT